MAVDKLNILLKQQQKLFHTNDLGLLWEIQNRNTLYTTIARFTRKGVLSPVHKGLYSVVPLHQLDPVYLGVHILHRYAYLSTETVLANAGVISQMVYPTTFVSDVSRSFSFGNNQFLCRKLKPEFLHNPAGIEARADGVFIATIERAIADMRYFQPTYHFDSRTYNDWKKVKKIQQEVGYI